VKRVCGGILKKQPGPGLRWKKYEAIEVGIKMGGAPAVVSAGFAFQVMEEVYKI
jgi:hypothetical protein